MIGQELIEAAAVLWGGLWHATALAIVTAVVSLTILRRCSPGVQALLWTVVLLKFLLPAGLMPGLFSFSSSLTALWQPTPAGAPAALPGIDGAAAFALEAAPAAPQGQPWYAGALVLLYLAGVSYFLFRWGLESYRLRRELKRLTPPQPPLAAEVSRLSRSAGLRRVPRVRVSETPGSPCLVGLFRTTLVLPVPVLARLDAESRRALIRHELAHLRRGDLWVRWLQNLARTLFFFWPPVWWVCRRIERFTEMACDQWAVAASRLSQRQYAESVLEVARCLAAGPPGRVNLALVGRGPLLEERFEMILNWKHAPRRSWLWAPLLLIWVPFALAGVPGPSQEQEPKQEHRFVWHVSGTNQENEFELPAEVLEAIPEADLNGDGVVTIGELKLHLQGEEGPHRIQIRAVKKTGPGGEESDPEVTVVFQSGDVSTILHEHPEADLDGDGALSKQELHEFARQAQPEGMKTRVRAIRVEHGEGSEEPFIVQLHGDGDYTAILERHPDADLDGDGALTREELLEWMKTQHEGEPVQFRLHSRALMLPHSEHGEEDVIVWHSKDGQIDVSGAGSENVFVRRVEPGEVDLDGNGLISEAELEAFRETCCPEAEGAGKVVIAIAPESGAGSDAWQVHASREEESGDRLGRLLEKYPDADLNGDGVLSKEEALALAARLQREGRKEPPN